LRTATAAVLALIAGLLALVPGLALAFDGHNAQGQPCWATRGTINGVFHTAELGCVADASAPAIRVLRGGDGTLYVSEGTSAWTMTPGSISDDEAAAMAASGELDGAIPSPLLSTTAPAPLEAVQTSDGTVYLRQEGNAWLLVPEVASDADVAGLNIIGEITSTIAAPGLGGPLPDSAPQPPTLAAPAPALAPATALAPAPQVLVQGAAAPAPALAAGVVVTTCTEASLNAALAGAGSIAFSCGGPATITITRTKSIAANTSIDGGGQVTFSGGGSTGSQFRLFDVRSGVTLSLSNLTVRDAFVPTEAGGAIRSQGTLNATNVTFLNNVAAGGGAILTFGSGATLNVTNSTFTNNSADTPQVGGNGGAIDQRDGQVTISGSTFGGNHAQRGGNGGAINTLGLGHLSVAASTFTNNAAHFSGGAIASGNVLALTGSTFSSNTAYDGGALWSGGTGSNVDGATIQGNTASDNGGGIVTGGGTLAVTNSTLDGNTAGQFGGGIANTFTSLTVSNARITNNHAGADGGGINTTNKLAIDHATLSGNVAAGNGGAVGQKAFGLRNTITASTLSGNRAGNAGGALMTLAGSLFTDDSTITNNTAQRGGAASLSADMGFSNTTIANNTASFTTGGVYNSAQYQAVFFSTILANNTVGERSQNCNTTQPSLGYNLDGDGTCSLTSSTDLNGIDPKLGPLQDNGGPTQTMLPAADSLAVDAGGPSTPEPQFGFACPAADQRGTSRPQGHACDIGAVETAPR
jgi:hypothetical protein